MQTARDLFEHELKDVYDAESRLVDALQTMESKVTDDKLAAAFREHREQTERQSQRLIKVFAAAGFGGPEREECEGIKGLIAEFDEFAKGDHSDAVLNLFASVAARKVEHYEIVSYESLIDLVTRLGIDEALPTLQEILAEDRGTAKQLEAMSDKLMTELP